MRLILVRHGEPDYENDRLTGNGMIQAELTAGELKGNDIKAVYSSPMGRAYDTALYTAKELDLPVKKLDFMHEIDWGDREDKDCVQKLEYNGHPWALGFKLLRENTEYIGSMDWDKHPYFRDNKCLEYYNRVSERFDEFLKDYGYIRKDNLYYCRDGCKDTVAIFAHGGSGAIMLSHVLNLPFPFVLTTMPFGLCSISIIELWPEKEEMTVPILELFNYTGHLGGQTGERQVFEK